MLLLIDATSHLPLTAEGAPLLFPELPAGIEVTTRVQITPEVTAARLRSASAADLAPRTGHARNHADNYLVSRAVGLLAARERYAFDPTDGSPLTWGESGIVARGASGTPIFPRIDPCVIGVVEHAAGDRILLGENRRRPGFFTCIAGYMDVGESAEDAFAREVMEETGRRVTDIAYVGSQPWALSGSLMLGFRARTADETQVGDTDGELSQVIWATREDLGELTLAPEGSIARQLIERWAAGEI